MSFAKTGRCSRQDESRLLTGLRAAEIENRAHSEVAFRHGSDAALVRRPRQGHAETHALRQALMCRRDLRRCALLSLLYLNGPLRNDRASVRIDRLLWVVLSTVWRNWRQAVQIVMPASVVRNGRRAFAAYWRWNSRPHRAGRPPLAADLRALIRQMRVANPLWGAPRIHGELQKLGIDVSQATVANYLGRRTCPSRIRCQAATGSWTRSRQWETQRTWFRSAGATVCPPAKVNGVWPSNDAWLRAAL